ncbi:MAG TPA: urate hydroxylase PuuD [Bacteroidota bacterium]|nr:urate hydroxylase PuuD [Bacteroidota bacterium]
MEVMDLLHVLFRWLHIAAGIIWIGHLYFFNFVNIPFAGTLDAETKKKVVPELLPRALYWFRWGAAYTWVTGVLLLGLVFYHGGLMFENPERGWDAPAIVMLLVTFGGFALYDALAKSPLGKDLKSMGAIGFVLIAAVMYLMIDWAGFSYRAYNIHIGTLFGTIMAANVWMRIWPSQKKVIAAVKEGTTPDPAVVALVGTRSRHNTFLSVPLFYTMINMHTTPPGGNSPLYLLGAVALGWIAVQLTYRKSASVKGM